MDIIPIAIIVGAVIVFCMLLGCCCKSRHKGQVLSHLNQGGGELSTGIQQFGDITSYEQAVGDDSPSGFDDSPSGFDSSPSGVDDSPSGAD